MQCSPWYWGTWWPRAPMWCGATGEPTGRWRWSEVLYWIESTPLYVHRGVGWGPLFVCAVEEMPTHMHSFMVCSLQGLCCPHGMCHGLSWYDPWGMWPMATLKIDSPYMIQCPSPSLKKETLSPDSFFLVPATEFKLNLYGSAIRHPTPISLIL